MSGSEVTQPPERDPIPAGQAIIKLECVGVGAPLTVRVKRLLKHILRTHGMRCVSVDMNDGGEKGAGVQ